MSALLDHLRPYVVASFWNTAYVHCPGEPLLAVWATSLAKSHGCQTVLEQHGMQYLILNLCCSTIDIVRCLPA